MGVKLVSSGGGSVEINPPATASGYIATMPARTGNVTMDGPAASAYLPTVAQSITTSTWTKVALSAEDFDLDGSFNSTGSTVGTAPAYSFNPQVAGYYQINGQIATNATGVQTVVSAAIYKNGSSVARSVIALTTGATFDNATLTTSKLVYLNGSTDYVQLYGYVAATNNPRFDYGMSSTFMTCVLVRGA